MFLKRFFTTILIIFSILMMYASPVKAISYADFLLLCLYPILIIDLIKKEKKGVKIIIYSPLFVVFLYVLFQFLFLLVFKDKIYIEEVLNRTIHYLFYLFTLMIFVKNYFDYTFGYRFFKIFALISSIYLIIQYFLYLFFAYDLSGMLPVKMMIETVNDSGIRSIAAASNRPRSFFIEPSAYALFVCFFLSLELYKKNNSKINGFIVEIICSFGILLSGSSLGIILCSLIWGVFIIKSTNIFSKKANLKVIVILMICIPVIVFIYIKSPFYDFFIDRMFSDNGELGQSAIGRFGGYGIVFNFQNSTNFEIVFGKGMRDYLNNQYIPALPRIFFYYGLMGYIVYGIAIYLMIKKADERSRFLILIMIIASIGGDAFFGAYLMQTIPFISNSKKVWKEGTMLSERNYYS